MSLNVVLTEYFTQDLDIQQDWYTKERDEELGLGYVRAVERTIGWLADHATLGILCRFPSKELAGLRRYLVEKPFQSNLIFYRVEGSDLIAARVVSGWRDIARRLLEPPGAI
jgi:hypothetical protein